MVRRLSMRPGRLLFLFVAFALAGVLGHFVGSSMNPGHHNLASLVAASSVDASPGPGSVDGRSPDGAPQAVTGLPYDHVAGDFACGALVSSLLLLLLPLLRRGKSGVLKMPLTGDPAKIPPEGNASTKTSSHQKRLAILSVSRC